VERRVHQRTRILFLVCSCLFIAGLASAQEPPSTDVGLQWGGAVEWGYRFTDVHGSNARYREVVNLENGPRLFDLSLWLKDLEKDAFADEVRLRLHGFGDPYPSGRLEVKKNKVYDLTAEYREYDYFFNRQDFPPSLNDPNQQLLTDNLDFNQKRRLGRVNLALFPAEEIRLNIGYNYAQRTGVADVPRAFTFVPRVTQDLDEQFQEYYCSIDFPLGGWDIHIKQSIWTFDSDNAINDSIDSGGLSQRVVEKREESVWTSVSTIKAHTHLGDRWDFDAGYIFAHSEGDAQLEVLRGIPIQVRPGNAEFHFDTHIVELGLSHLLREDLILHFDYRMHTFDQNGDTPTDLFSLSQKVTETDYSLFAHTGTLQLEYTPRDNLTLRCGYRGQYRLIDSENFAPNEFSGGANSSSDRILSHGWVASGDWKPFRFLSFFGEYEGAAFDNPYTRISPENQNIARFRTRYETPIKGMNLVGTFLWKQRTNPDQQYRLDIQDYVLAATYQPSALPKLTLDASYTYEKIQDTKEIANEAALNPPPAPPLFSTFNFDSDAEIFSGGISYEGIYKGLGGRLGGSYARTRFEDSEEYYVASLSFWYKNRWLIPIVTVERYRLKDFENHDDSFSATLVMLSLRKEF
jgi:hypothetical protein